jgi:two-component system catabolic regulation response regulator CreB
MQKILLIEDDNTIRSILSYALSQKGYEVLDCMFIRDAAALVAVERFDLIISDIGLPDGNGLDFCSRQQKIPFVIMSGQERSEMAKANGARAYVEKPFRVNDILAAIVAANA